MSAAEALVEEGYWSEDVWCPGKPPPRLAPPPVRVRALSTRLLKATQREVSYRVIYGSEGKTTNPVKADEAVVARLGGEDGWRLLTTLYRCRDEEGITFITERGLASALWTGTITSHQILRVRYLLSRFKEAGLVENVGWDYEWVKYDKSQREPFFAEVFKRRVYGNATAVAGYTTLWLHLPAKTIAWLKAPTGRGGRRAGAGRPVGAKDSYQRPSRAKPRGLQLAQPPPPERPKRVWPKLPDWTKDYRPIVLTPRPPRPKSNNQDPQQEPSFFGAESNNQTPHPISNELVLSLDLEDQVLRTCSCKTEKEPASKCARDSVSFLAEPSTSPTSVAEASLPPLPPEIPDPPGGMAGWQNNPEALAFLDALCEQEENPPDAPGNPPERPAVPTHSTPEPSEGFKGGWENDPAAAAFIDSLCAQEEDAPDAPKPKKPKDQPKKKRARAVEALASVSEVMPGIQRFMAPTGAGGRRLIGGLAYTVPLTDPAVLSQLPRLPRLVWLKPEPPKLDGLSDRQMVQALLRMYQQIYEKRTGKRAWFLKNGQAYEEHFEQLVAFGKALRQVGGAPFHWINFAWEMWIKDIRKGEDPRAFPPIRWCFSAALLEKNADWFCGVQYSNRTGHRIPNGDLGDQLYQLHTAMLQDVKQRRLSPQASAAKYFPGRLLSDLCEGIASAATSELARLTARVEAGEILPHWW